MKRVLHVGCGSSDLRRLPQSFQDGWVEVRLDIDPRATPDIVGSITHMNEVASASMDAVFCSHNLEHIYAHEVPVALAEFRRVLKDTGFAMIVVPDISSAAKAIVERGLDAKVYESPGGPITPFDMLYGHSGMVRDSAFMAHKCGFTQATLKAALHPFFEFIVTAIRSYELIGVGFVKASSAEEGMQRFGAVLGRATSGTPAIPTSNPRA